MEEFCEWDRKQNVKKERLWLERRMFEFVLFKRSILKNHLRMQILPKRIAEIFFKLKL